jgi:segregation and condensation protein A
MDNSPESVPETPAATAPEENNAAPPIEQLALPLAMVQGTAITEMPHDLYIPPDALRVFLEETFEGPLDLLLYLIQRENLDILNIPIAEITRQYLRYIQVMQVMQLELAAEYLVMAAILLEIKSRLLLPRPPGEDGSEDDQDPRARLVQQLQEYARFKKAALELAELPLLGRDVFLVEATMPELPRIRVPPKIPLQDLLYAMRDVLSRLELFAAHQIIREPLSVRERMTRVLELVQEHQTVALEQMFTLEEGRAGVVVSLLAVLELTKELLIEVRQDELFGPVTALSKPA